MKKGLRILSLAATMLLAATGAWGQTTGSEAKYDVKVKDGTPTDTVLATRRKVNSPSNGVHDTSFYPDTPSDNNVVFDDKTGDFANVEYVYGGFLDGDGSASNNTVTIGGGVTLSKVYGGWVSGTGTAQNNHVIIANASVTDLIVGGHTGDGNVGSVSGNNLEVRSSLTVGSIENFGDISATGDVTAGSVNATTLIAPNHTLTLTGTGSNIVTTALADGTLTVDANAGGDVGSLTARTVNLSNGSDITATKIDNLNNLFVTGGILTLGQTSNLSASIVTLAEDGVVKTSAGSLTVGYVSGAGTIQGKDGLVLKSGINNPELNIVAETKDITAADGANIIKAKSLTATNGNIVATGKNITATGDVKARSVSASSLSAENLTLTGKGSEIGTTNLGTGTLTVNANAGGNVGTLTAGMVNVNDGGSLEMNMPKTGTIDLALATVGTVRVYDDGGMSGNYSSGCNSTLVITVPAGCHVNVTSNSIALKQTSSDFLNIYDNNTASGTMLGSVTGDSYDGSPIDYTSTGNYMTIHFESSTADGDAAGFDLTVTVLEPTYDLSGTVTDGTGSVTFTVDGTAVTTAKENDVVTVTVTGAEGFAATSLTATAGTSGTLTPEKTKGHIGVWTLTMPADAVSVAAELEDVWGISGGADGSADHPYAIGTTLGLDLLAEKVNGGTDYAGKNFKLTADLDYSTAEFQFDKNDDGEYQSNYQAIGGIFEGFRCFKGSFNGDGHTVKGITIVKKGTSGGGAYQGLFGIVGTGGSVSHVTLDASSIIGNDGTGGIVGYNYKGTITDCHVTDGVSIQAVQSNAICYGGIVGYNYDGGSVMGCTSAANISGADGGTSNIGFGGIVGYNEDGTIKDCIYLGSQVGGNAYVGAIAGLNYNGNVLNCYFTTAGLEGIDGDGQVTTDDGAGSAIGYNYNATATNVGLARTITLEGDVAISGTATDYAENVTAPAMHLTAYTPSGSSDPNALMLATSDGDAWLFATTDAYLGLSYAGATGEGYLVEVKATKTENGSDVTSLLYDDGILNVPNFNVTFSATGEDVWGVSGDNPNDGTQEKPYTITTPSGFKLLAKQVNENHVYYAEKFFVLGGDVEFEHKAEGEDGWEEENNYTAIGYWDRTHDYYFKGTFDGCGHTVKGIRIYKGGVEHMDSYQGLFGQIGELGSVSHLTLDDARIAGFRYIGGIAGANLGGSITDCHVTANVYILELHADTECHGGIVGGSKNLNSGGIANGIASHGGIVSGCTSQAKIAVAHNESDPFGQGGIGGIAGYNFGGTIKDCLYLGNEVVGTAQVGAIVGYNDNGNILNCYFTTAGLEGISSPGQVTADDAVGSAIGYNGGTATATNVGLARTVTLEGDVAINGTATDYAATVANPQTAVTAYAPGTDEAGFALTLTTGDGTTTHYSVADAEVGIKYTGTLPAGATPTFTVTADSGELVSVTASGSAYSFLMPADNVTVSVMTGTTVSVAAQSWATYCIDQAVSLAGGQTDCGLYTLSAVGTESVTLSEITGTASAGTPLMIWNGSDEPKTVVLNYAAEPATATEHASEFVGTLADTDVSTVSAPAVYVLYNNSFMRTHTGSIPAHRAYIALTTANAARSLSIGSTTGITAPFTTEETGTVYDMSGRKVHDGATGGKLNPGVYIINGKKRVVR